MVRKLKIVVLQLQRLYFDAKTFYLEVALMDVSSVLGSFCLLGKLLSTFGCRTTYLKDRCRRNSPERP